MKIEDLSTTDIAILRSAYEDAFPPELRVPFSDLRDDVVLGFLDAGEPAGMAVVRDLGAGRWFLRYFYAVRRGAGAGSAMWSALEGWCRTQGGMTLLLDVEDPTEEIDDPEETRVRERRVAFYERNGAQVLLVPGYAPEHDFGDHAHAPAMQLLHAALDIPPTERAPLSVGAVREELLAVMVGRYGYAPDDAAVQALLASV